MDIAAIGSAVAALSIQTVGFVLVRRGREWLTC